MKVKVDGKWFEFEAPVLFEKILESREHEISFLKSIIMVYHRRGTFTAQQGQKILDISRGKDD